MPGPPLSRAPAASAASWKASTVARSAATFADPEEGEVVAEPADVRDRLHDAPHPERRERLLVERLARGVVADVESYVVEPRLHGLSISLKCRCVERSELGVGLRPRPCQEVGQRLDQLLDECRAALGRRRARR